MRMLKKKVISLISFNSGAAAKRFPTYEHMVEAGLMTETELEEITILEKVDSVTEIGDSSL